MPARHTSRQTICSSEQIQIGWLGRRKRVSARHQVKRLDRLSEGFALPKPVRQKKQVFFLGAESLLRNFTGPKARLKSGPDVFADALVPRNVPVPRNVSHSPERFAFRLSRLRCRASRPFQILYIPVPTARGPWPGCRRLRSCTAARLPRGSPNHHWNFCKDRFLGLRR